ncbi:VOC family protein [Streptomyces pratensis]|uniref:VOC family protein n=1 Tax=Streptomyces pratensis TaxID=1169025 RepID=UPI00301A760E
MTVEKTSVLVLDCADHLELAEFYAGLLDAQTRTADDPDFVEVVAHDGVRLAIRRDQSYVPPSWPRPAAAQEARLRVLVRREDIDEAEREAIGLGARPVDTGETNNGPRDVRVYADPAGHSFALAVTPLPEG